MTRIMAAVLVRAMTARPRDGEGQPSRRAIELLEVW